MRTTLPLSVTTRSATLPMWLAWTTPPSATLTATAAHLRSETNRARLPLQQDDAMLSQPQASSASAASSGTAFCLGAERAPWALVAAATFSTAGLCRVSAGGAAADLAADTARVEGGAEQDPTAPTAALLRGSARGVDAAAAARPFSRTGVASAGAAPPLPHPGPSSRGALCWLASLRFTTSA